jgi:endonuclease I
MKSTLLFLFSLFSTFLFAQQPYYNDVDFLLNGTSLKDELSVKIISTHTNILTYSERHNYLYDADEDAINTSNVILIYNGESRDEREYLSGSNTYMPQTFNTEHVYPQSLLSNDPPKGDLHHLRVCDIAINSSRGNLPFASGTGSYGTVTGGWFPGNDWKGDVARMIMYMHLRYDEPFEDVGNLALFLQWNSDDPVTPFEDQRNELIFNVQGNRNPFIDNPYIATKIWGGPSAEDRWGTLGVENYTIEEFKVYPLPALDHQIYIQSDTNMINQVALYSITGQAIFIENNPQRDNNTIVLDNLPSGFYVLKINSEKGITSKKVIIN